MRNRPILQLVVFIVVGSVIGIPIALVIPWFPAEASSQAHNVHTLYDVLLIASVPIFMIVLATIVMSVWKYRMKPGEEHKDGPPIHGNTRLEVVWTTIPAILILGLISYAYAVLRQNEDSKRNEMTVNVTARQFAFEFTYDDNGKTFVSPVLYLADHQPVVFRLRSYDVVHSFFVPEFSEKLDAVPGIVTTVRVTPTRIGSYPVECTELCGAGHSLMRSTAYVVTRARFNQWLSSQRAGGAPPIGSPPPNAVAVPPGASSAGSAGTSTTPSGSSSATSAAAGKAVFTGSAGCTGCHTLAAAGATGTVGPDLDTRLRSDCALAASKQVRGATLEECIHTAIVKPYAYIPTGYHAGVMPPNFSQTLTSTQIQALVAFLASATK